MAALAVASFLGYHEFHAFSLSATHGSGAEVAYMAGSNARVTAPRVALAISKPAPAVVPSRAVAVASAATAAPDAHAGLVLASSQPDDSSVMPSARLIAATLAAARMNGSVGSTFANFQTGFETQTASLTTQMDEPLANMTTPSEERRDRLMASATPAMAASGGLSERVSERIASRLSDDRLYEQMSRYGVGATAVSIKF